LIEVLCLALYDYGAIQDDDKWLYIDVKPVTAVFSKMPEYRIPDYWVGSINQKFFIGSTHDIRQAICEIADE
tara:strand:+ start:1307 stop:1522 length:216 start_codon:yes stop_codon:yes gene_type:complete